MVMAAAGKNHDLLHRIESILGMRNKNWNPVRQLSIAFLTMLGVTLLHLYVSTKEQKPRESFYTLSNELSPYYFLNGKNVPVNKLVAKVAKANPAKKKNSIMNPLKDGFVENYSAAIDPGFMNVGFSTPVIPELAPEEESKVKEAVDATKKILQETEWKAFEKNYAEVFNSAEKTKLKSEYIYEVDKVNWNKLEDQLRLSYSQINWDNVNEKINTSLAQIKLDSIQHQVNVSLKTFINLEKALKENNVNAIPDTDITLQIVQENQQKAREQLQIIKAAKVKKIVRL